IKVIERTLAPFLISMQQNLGIGSGAELITKIFQFGADLLKVVDLTVVDDHHIASLICHRLMTGYREVYDCQATVPQAHRPIREVTFAVRPAMRNEVGHA